MSVIGRWKITAPRSPRRGENWRLECGALDGQIIPAGESVIVVPEQQLQGAVARADAAEGRISLAERRLQFAFQRAGIDVDARGLEGFVKYAAQHIERGR